MESGRQVFGATPSGLGNAERAPIVVEEETTERFGPVLVVKSEDGQVLHVQQAHSFTNRGVLGASPEEARDTIEEIKQQVNSLPPDPAAEAAKLEKESAKDEPGDRSDQNQAASSKDEKVPGNTELKAAASGKNAQPRDGDKSQDMTTTTTSTPTDGNGEAPPEHAPFLSQINNVGGSLHMERTARFGEVYVVKNDAGATVGVFPKSDYSGTTKDAVTPERIDTGGVPNRFQKQPSPRQQLRTQDGLTEAKLDDKSSTLEEPGKDEAAALSDTKRSIQDNEQAATVQPIMRQASDRVVGAEAGGETDFMPISRKYSDGQFREELYEFGNFRKMPWYTRAFYSIERDVFNWYGSFLSLINHGWGFESFITLALAVASTCFFCYYRTAEGTPLAARLDFSIIGSALVFPVTFLIAETFRRRENAIQRLASIKALLCQIEIAMLTWRWKGPGTDLGVEWEDRVHQTLHHIVNTMTSILQLPTWNTNRHIYTGQGREFKARVIKRERELTRRMGLLFSELHWYVEDLKERGLPANEASRINQYHSLLQIDFEALAMVKSYRTPNVSRSFVRIMVLVMPIFYGPYFAWVSGSIGGGAQTNPAFAIALTIVTVIVLLGLVRVQRAMEDPFTSHFPGDVIDLISEQLDAETRLNLIVACSRERKRVRALKAPLEGVPS